MGNVELEAKEIVKDYHILYYYSILHNYIMLQKYADIYSVVYMLAVSM